MSGAELERELRAYLTERGWREVQPGWWRLMTGGLDCVRFTTGVAFFEERIREAAGEVAANARATGE